MHKRQLKILEIQKSCLIKIVKGIKKHKERRDYRILTKEEKNIINFANGVDYYTFDYYSYVKGLTVGKQTSIVRKINIFNKALSAKPRTKDAHIEDKKYPSLYICRAIILEAAGKDKNTKKMLAIELRALRIGRKNE